MFRLIEVILITIKYIVHVHYFFRNITPWTVYIFILLPLFLSRCRRETQRQKIPSGYWYLVQEVYPLTTAMLSQGSYRAVSTRLFHGEIRCDSNTHEDIRTSNHSEWLDTSNHLSLPTYGNVTPSGLYEYK